MSNIYIQEPPTEGKVLLKTTVGDIDIELWSKETPKACRNFIQLCLEGYYNGTIFHRIVKGFIAQGGDPTATGTGGESIYGQPFKDEFHTRLRFNRRGLVAMANAGKDDNGSQFFFTFAATPELQNKHTIFGKVTGETVYNMMKLEDALVGNDDRPEYPQKINKCDVLHNPFSDIVPRTVLKTKEKKVKNKEKSTGVKNFKLLSFGEEAEEDEEQTSNANEQLRLSSKSLHDVANDPKLSSVPAVELPSTSGHVEDDALSGDQSSSENEDHDSLEKMNRLERVKRQLKKGVSEKCNQESENEEEFSLEKERREEKKRKVEGIRKEIDDLKKSYQESKKLKSGESKSTGKESSKQAQDEQNPLALALKEEERKYKLKYNFPKKGSSREAYTLDLLDKFRKKVQSMKESSEPDDSQQTTSVDDEKDVDEDIKNDKWMAHQLKFESKSPVLAKDANTKDNDWYEIHDPRSKINQQRREISKNLMKNRERR